MCTHVALDGRRVPGPEKRRSPRPDKGSKSPLHEERRPMDGGKAHDIHGREGAALGCAGLLTRRSL